MRRRKTCFCPAVLCAHKVQKSAMLTALLMLLRITKVADSCFCLTDCCVFSSSGSPEVCTGQLWPHSPVDEPACKCWASKSDVNVFRPASLDRGTGSFGMGSTTEAGHCWSMGCVFVLLPIALGSQHRTPLPHAHLRLLVVVGRQST